jgi:Flp pilus assembly protein TadD
MAPIPNPTKEDRRQAPRPAPRATETSPRLATPAKPAPAAPKPAASPGRDPAKAQLLRAQGLEQLNRGAINKAQDLLRQALQLDPGNALIQRDLDRATRIGRAVKAKP